jgi:hypothetical protein
MFKCENCGDDIIDDGEIPVLMDITGWTVDSTGEDTEEQLTIRVCKDCLRNKPEEIIEKLSKYYKYE